MTLRPRLTILTALALAPACSRTPAVDAGIGTRAVVVGIDSADWTIIDQLIAEGDLPHLAALKQRGAWGDLATLTDIPLSPVVWTSVATGKTPAKHGVTWFLVDQPDGSRVPVRSTNRETEALWTITDRAGLRTQSIGWWATYPAERLEHGIIVSDAVGFHGFGRTARQGADEGKVSPSGLHPRFDALMPVEQQIGHEFVSRFVDISPEGFAEERFDPARHRTANPLNPIHLFQQYAVTARGYTAIAQELLDADAYELLLVYYEQVDSFSHLFMKYDPPRLPWASDRGVERYSRTVREWYRHQDELLGALLERIDLETTAVVLVSDHGFKVGDRRIRSERTVDISKAHLDHEPEGIFLVCGPHVRPGARIQGASVLDVTPTLLCYLGLPVGKDMDGRVLSEAFEPEFLEAHPLRYVATHETGSPRETAPLASDAGSDGDAEAVLRALGYVGADEEEPVVSDGASSPEIHNNLGRLHVASGDFDAALGEFQKALALDARDAEALLAIGRVHQLRGRSDLALHFAERALAVDPSSPGALSQLAEVQRDRGDLREAARLYRTALTITDAQPGLYVGLGDVLQRAGNFDGARKAFQRALELDPDDLAAIYNLGVTYGQMDRPEEARAMYETALALDPDHPQTAYVLNNLGALHRDAGRDDEALAAFEDAAARFPTHLESRFNAAMIHAEAERLTEAVALLREAAVISPNHELVQLQLGLACARTGESEDAFRALLLVRRLHPNNWQATVALAALQADAENVDDARALMAEARALGGADAELFASTFTSLESL